jgi:hypothetical protein
VPWSSFVSSTEIMPDTEVCRQAGEGRGGGTIQVDGEGMQGADREMSRGRGSTEFMPDTEVCRQGGGQAWGMRCLHVIGERRGRGWMA